jgi:DNA invertase Pin-like site-specific DNA recombinase
MNAEIARRFLRVSTGNQDEENQRADVDTHIASKGYDVYPEDILLNDNSASKGEHVEALESALADMAAGKYTVLVVAAAHRLDREDRLREWFNRAREAGGRIESAREPALNVTDDFDLGWRIMTEVTSWGNAKYSRDLRDNVKASHNARKARNALVGKVGWGYDSVCTVDGTPRCGNKQHDKIPMPTDLGRAYAMDVYTRALAGQSLRSISRWLSAETGQAISDTGVRNILTNPIYTGKHVYGDGTVCECEALVTSDMQAQVAKALRSRLRRGARGSKTEPALLIPRCLDCGGKAYRTATGGKVRGYAYYCRTCGYQVPCEKLDSIVFGTVMLYSADEDETALVWVEGSDSASERAEIKRAMRELDPDEDDYLEKASALRDALKALPEAIPGHFDEQETGRTKAEAILEVQNDRAAMRELLARWGVAFAKDGKWVRVKVNGGPEFRRPLVAVHPVGNA